MHKKGWQKRPSEGYVSLLYDEYISEPASYFCLSKGVEPVLLLPVFFFYYLHKCLHYLSGECVCLNVSFLQFSGELTAITPSTARVTPKETSAAVTLPQTTTATTDPVHKQSLTTTQPVTAQSGSRSNSTTQKVTTTSASSTLTTTQEAKMSNQHNKTRQLGRNTASPTVQSSRTGKKWGPCALALIIW